MLALRNALRVARPARAFSSVTTISMASGSQLPVFMQLNLAPITPSIVSVVGTSFSQLTHTIGWICRCTDPGVADPLVKSELVFETTFGGNSLQINHELPEISSHINGIECPTDNVNGAAHENSVAIECDKC